MESVESALDKVLREARRLPGRDVDLRTSLGATLDQAILADLDMPPFDKALVDGFAVIAGEQPVEGPWTLEIVDEIDAGGMPKGPIQAGQAALVMTGAPVPPGTDAVVMLEQSERIGDGRVRLSGRVKIGQNRLERGREYRAGELLLHPGTVLNAPRIGVLASTGHARVRVVERPRVAVVATGDELVGIADRPGPAQIRNSNGATLAALVNALGYDAETLPTLPDRREILADSFTELVNQNPRTEVADAGRVDLLLVSGGVSAGRRDLVPSALIDVGVRPVFHKVSVKPGKPLWFGVGPNRGQGWPPVLVFGLPGNPVGGIVSVLLFVGPALAALSGRLAAPAATELVRLGSRFEHRGERATYHPARRLAEKPGWITPLPWAGSADLQTVALADGFALFPAGDHDHEAGETVEFLAMPSTIPAPQSY